MVKLRVSLESGQDMDGNSRVTKDVLDEAKDKGYTEQATKYMIDNKLKLDTDDFPTTDPVKYAIDNNIKIEGKDAKQYALEKVIDEYLKTPNPEIKKELDARYKEIHQMGPEKTTALLSVDSSLGKFLDDEKNVKVIANHKAVKGKSVLQDVDFTKCDLALIEKYANAHEKTLKEKPRNYDNFTTAQKVGMAFSSLLGPLGPVVTYFAMKSHNKAEKVVFEKQLGQSLEGIQQDLGKISEVSQKSNPTISKSVSFKEVAVSENPLIKKTASLITPKNYELEARNIGKSLLETKDSDKLKTKDSNKKLEVSKSKRVSRPSSIQL